MGQKVQLSMNAGVPCVGDLVEKYAKKRDYDVEDCSIMMLVVMMNMSMEKKEFLKIWVPMLDGLAKEYLAQLK